MTATALTERAAAVSFLRKLAMSRPPECIRELRPEWTDDVLMLFEATFMVAADSIEKGVHLLVEEPAEEDEA